MQGRPSGVLIVTDTTPEEPVELAKVKAPSMNSSAGDTPTPTVRPASLAPADSDVLHAAGIDDDEPEPFEAFLFDPAMEEDTPTADAPKEDEEEKPEEATPMAEDS